MSIQFQRMWSKINIETIQFQKDSKTPLYIQLSKIIENMILGAELKENDKLPPIRKFAEALKVNNVTIINAYKNLEKNNLVEPVKGSGYYVRTMKSKLYKKENNQVTEFNIEADEDIESSLINLTSSGQITISEDTINFASAIPDPSIFPVDKFKNAINEVLERDKGNAFGYQESNGYEPLRKTLCKYLLQESNIKASFTDIQIVSGAQQGIDIIGKALLNFGDCIITENPTYTGAIDVFKSRGAEIVGVNIMQDGIDCEDLERKIKLYKPKLLYVMSNFQNPTTVTYSEEKLKRIMNLSRKYNFLIIEDDSLSGLGFKKDLKYTTLKSMDEDERVIYVKSFSKLIMPGLRMGFIISPKCIIDHITRAKHTTDISSSGLIQRTLHIYFEKGYWEENLEYMEKIYEEKYECMLRELNKLKVYGITFEEPFGGLNFWVTLPTNINAYRLYLECAKKDVVFLPSQVFSVNDDNKKMNNCIRLSYAGSSIDNINIGMSIIGECIDDILNKKNKVYVAPFL